MPNSCILFDSASGDAWGRNAHRYRQEEERPLSNIQLSFSPDWQRPYASYGFDTNALSAVTDEKREAILNVGNSCGTLLAAPVQGWNPTPVEPNGNMQFMLSEVYNGTCNQENAYKH